MNRREFVPITLSPLAAAAPVSWTPEWDRALIDMEVRERASQFDAKELMLVRRVGGAYQYHTEMRSRDVHPTRDSLDYALLLLEAGGEAHHKRAEQVIDRVISLQDTDPDSKWYGIWGWHMEEPPPRMQPADWNWADFNGSILLLIEYRHGGKLPPALRRRVLESIRHAAYSIRRRNVTMTYTNIAVQGTFVTLVAAQLLKDAELRAYAEDRLKRFAATVDQTGSFAEYNSPTYTNVTILNFTRIRMLEKDPDVLKRAGRIHHRAWLHLARHWHAPSGQLAGPMSRCYSTDIGKPLWLQKALGGRLKFATLDEVKAGKTRGGGETAILDYRCPDELAVDFLEFKGPREHREVFLPGKENVRPVQGTTWIEKDFTLGSVNRGDFWVQRRPLLAYWGSGGPARYVQARFIKDDYDFTSALLYSTQTRNYVLGLANFRSPGGDKHPSLDPVKDGQFTCSRFRLRFDIQGTPSQARSLEGDGRVAVDLGGAKLWFSLRKAVLGKEQPALVVSSEQELMTISVDLLKPGQPRVVRWTEVGSAYIAFTLAMEGAGGTLEDFDQRMRATRFEHGSAGSSCRLAWRTPAGELVLAGGTAVTSVDIQDRAFTETLDGKPAPLVRLSDERLA